jgi:hypothetical protein
MKRNEEVILELKQKFSFSYFRENFCFSHQNLTKSREYDCKYIQYTSCKNRWIHVLNFPLSQLIIKILIIFAFFCCEKRKFLRNAKTKTFRFNSRRNCVSFVLCFLKFISHLPWLGLNCRM